MPGRRKGLRSSQGTRVKIRTGEEVVHIRTESGKAVAVETAKHVYPADVVVSGADYHHVDQELLGQGSSQYSERYWEKRVVAPSMFIAYLGINRKLKNLEHHNLYFAEDWNVHFDTIFKKPALPQKPCFYLSCISKTDAKSAPEGAETYSFSFLWLPVSRYGRAAEAYLAHVLGPCAGGDRRGLTKDVAVQRIYSHRDFAQDYHAFKGTALGLSHTLMQTAIFRPSSRSKRVENVFFTGQYTHPGVGVPMVLIASEIVADEIRKTYGT